MTETKVLIKGILTAWKKNIKRLLPAQLIGRLLVVSILLPQFEKSVRFTLKITGYSYLTPKNAVGFFLNPLTWGVFLLWLFGIGFFCYCEFLLLTYFFHIREQKLNFSFPDLMNFCIHSFRHPLKRGLISQIWLSLLQEFVFLLLLFVFLLQRLRIPSYIWASLREIRIGWVAALILLAALFILGFFFSFALHYCFLEGRGAKEGIIKSMRLLRGNRLRTLAIAFAANLLWALLIAAVYLVILAVTAGVIHLTAAKGLALNTFLVVYDKINLYYGLLIAVVVVYLNQGMFTHLYYRFKDARNELTSREEISEYIEVNKIKKYVYLSRAMLAGVVLLSAFSLYDIVYNGAFHPEDFLPVITITSHRGQSVEAPENTMPAIELAAQEMADYAEIDVRRTSDGILVLMHDASVKRTTGHSGKVSDMTFAQIEELDAGSRFHEGYAGTRVPTLEEAIAYSKGTIKLNIELKPSGDEVELASKTLELIDKYDFSDQCIISSANRNVLKEVKAGNGNIKVGYIMTGVYGDFYEKEKVDFFSIRSDFVTRYMVERIHELGHEIHVWTVNTRSELERMKNLGVDSIITDDAVLAREIIFMKKEDDSFLELMRLILDR